MEWKSGAYTHEAVGVGMNPAEQLSLAFLNSLTLEADELVGVFREVRYGHPAALLDKLGHRFQLVLRDVDELAPVVQDTCYPALV